VRLQGDTGAWERRLLIVRYSIPRSGDVIDEYDKVLVRHEGSGILNFALAGFTPLMDDLDTNHGRIKLSQQQSERVKKLLNESESLRIFIRDSIIRDPKLDLTAGEILEEYFKDCISNNLQPLELDKARRSLDALMMDLFAVRRSNSIRRNNKNQTGFLMVKFK